MWDGNKFAWIASDKNLALSHCYNILFEIMRDNLGLQQGGLPLRQASRTTGFSAPAARRRSLPVQQARCIVDRTHEPDLVAVLEGARRSLGVHD